LQRLEKAIITLMTKCVPTDFFIFFSDGAAFENKITEVAWVEFFFNYLKLEDEKNLKKR